MPKEAVILSSRKVNRIKRYIHRRIFEDNLRLAGLTEALPKTMNMNPVMLKCAFFLVAIFSYSLVNEIRVPEYTPRAVQPVPGLMTRAGEYGRDEFVTMREEKESDPADYQMFLNQSLISLREIFGLKVRTIVIDPGHGGEDPGTSGSMGTHEKDLTLDIAKKLKERLSQHPGYRILLTRNTDITLPLEARINFANAENADLYISLHVNYIPSKPYGVIETYYFGPNTDRRALLLAEKENAGTQHTMGDFKKVIEKIRITIKYQESRILARSIQNSLYSNIHRQNGNVFNYGVKTAPFVVLLGVDMPSVLTEVTCLNNIEEEKKLISDVYREEIAGYLEEGIARYLNSQTNTSNREV